MSVVLKRSCVLWIGLLLIVGGGCDSADNGEAADPPAVVPEEAFTMQTDLFDQGESKRTAVGTHFTAAALRVWPVSVVINANLIIPAAVTGAALQEEPTIEEGTWIWSSTTMANGQEVSFTLSGTPDGSQVDWTMHITKTTASGTEEFDLFTAETALDGSSGTWQLYYPIKGEQTNVLNAEFTVTSESEKEITFRIPETAGEHAGDSVRYEHDGDQRTFVWTQVAEGLEHRVTWNATTHAGSITATNYQEGEQACWDANLNNTSCTE